MRNRIALILVALFSATLLVAAENGNDQDKSKIDQKIIELKKERIQILKQRVEALESQHKEGDIQIMKVIHAKEDLYQAQLALVSERKQRVELFKSRLQNMIELENVAKMRFENGIGPLENKYVAAAARIEAEIDYLNEEKNLE